MKSFYSTCFEFDFTKKSWNRVTGLVSKLISRKIREIFLLNLHSVEKYYKMRSWFLRKNLHFFREIDVLSKEVTKELISRNFFCVTRNGRITGFIIRIYVLSPKKKIRQINCFVISLVKTLLSRNFCLKRVTVNFHNFHTVIWAFF